MSIERSIDRKLEMHVKTVTDRGICLKKKGGKKVINNIIRSDLWDQARGDTRTRKKNDLDGTEVIVNSGEYRYFIFARREFSFNLKLFLRQRYE